MCSVCSHLSFAERKVKHAHKSGYYGRPWSNDQKKEFGSIVRRRWASVNYKTKMSQIHKERWADSTIRANYVASHTGRVASTSSRKKLSATWKRLGHPRGMLGKKMSLVSKQRMALARGRHSIPNKAERRLDSILCSHYPGKFRLNVKNGVIIGGKIADFIHVSKKIVVEMFGDYWHSKKLTGRTPKQEELRRRNHFSRYGYRTVIVWEAELKNEPLMLSKLAAVRP